MGIRKMSNLGRIDDPRRLPARGHHCPIIRIKGSGLSTVM
jgi:hypothetical protein